MMRSRGVSLATTSIQQRNSSLVAVLLKYQHSVNSLSLQGHLLSLFLTYVGVLYVANTYCS